MNNVRREMVSDGAIVVPWQPKEVGKFTHERYFFLKLHASRAGGRCAPARRTAVRLSISFPCPVFNPRKAHRKDTGIRIAKEKKKNKEEEKEEEDKEE